MAASEQRGTRGAMRPVLLLSILAALACKSPSKEPAGAAAKPGAAPAAPATDAPWAKRPTADCPAYPGRAAVTLTDVDGGYTALLETADASAVNTIRDHARYLVGASAAQAGADALRFGGATGDRSQNCPILLDGTIVTSEDVPNGVRMTVVARDPAQVDALRKDARERADVLAAIRDLGKK